VTALLQKVNQLERGTSQGRFTVAARSCKDKLSWQALLSTKEQRNCEGYSGEAVARPRNCCLGPWACGDGTPPGRAAGPSTIGTCLHSREGEAEPRHCWRLSGPPWLSVFNALHKELP